MPATINTINQNTFEGKEEAMEARYERTINGQCLVLDLQKRAQIIDFQIEMIRYNPHPQILPVEKRKLNSKIELHYQLGEHLSLEQYYQGNLKPDEILRIMESVINCINLSRNYLLYRHSFLLDMHYIFIHPRTKSIALVYQPVKLTDDLNVKLKELLEMLMKTVCMDDFKKEKVVLKQIEEFQNLQDFSIAGLQEVIRETKISDRINKLGLSKSQEPEKPFRLNTVMENRIKNNIENNNRINKVYLFLLIQVVFILIIVFFLEKLEKLGNPIIIYGLVIACLTIANILVMDKYLLKKKGMDEEEKNIISKKVWQGQLVEKMVMEKDILRKEFAQYK
jgi:hypothetical protein